MKPAPLWSNCETCTPLTCRCTPAVTKIELQGRVKRLRLAGRLAEAARLESLIK